MAEIVERLRAQGLHPSPLPLGLLRPGEAGRLHPVQHLQFVSVPGCTRRATPKSAASGRAIAQPNVTLWTRARAPTAASPTPPAAASTPSKSSATARRFASTAPLFIVSCGAVNSAALLLRSANDAHPDGLANSSGLVGRRYMAHLATMMQGFHPFRRNDDVFQKTVAINDFYLRGPRHAVSARPDPVAGTHARRDGADASCRGFRLGLRRVGRARRRLAGDVGGSAAAENRVTLDAGRPHPARSTGRTTSRAHEQLVDESEAHPPAAGLLGRRSRTRTRQQEHDAPVRHAVLRHRSARRRCSIRSAARTTSTTSSSSTRRSSPRRRR